MNFCKAFAFGESEIAFCDSKHIMPNSRSFRIDIGKWDAVSNDFENLA